MKKSVAVFFAVSAIFVILSGCTSGVNNEIRPADLTAGQQDIVNLLTTGDQEVFIFDYQAEGAFAMEFWIEIYAYGELIESIEGLKLSRHDNRINPLNGRLAVAISNEDDGSFRWEFAVIDGDFRATNIVDFAFHTENAGARTHGPTQEAVSIEDGRGIILHTTKFRSGHTVFTDGSRVSQDYIGQPELLAGYSYVILVKARFSSAAH